MRKISSAILLFVIFMNTILLTGCWNYREISNLAIVTGFAIDKDPDMDGYIITTEIVNFEASGREAKIRSKTIESKGETIFDAIRDMLQVSGRRLYWAHTKVVIISQDVAMEGLSKVFDVIYRDAELRTDMYPLISIEKTAKEIFVQLSGTSEISAYEIKDMVESQKSLGETPLIQVYQYISSISGKMAPGILPAIALTMSGEKRTSRLKGTAVFKNDRLVGFTDSHETKYMLFAMKQFKRGLLIEHENSNGKQNKITLEVFDTQTKLKPELENGNLKMVLNINIDAAIAELETPKDYIEEREHDKLEKDSSAALQKNIKGIIKKVQNDFDTDIFRFDKYIKADMPSVWNSVEKNWDETFKNLNVDVKVEIHLRNSAMASKPIKVGE